jgi:DnaJ domain
MNPRGIDYYAVLQVHPDAEAEVIEAAYRQLMRKYHPDVGGTDPDSAARAHERAKAINQAYAVLRDPLQRGIYDGMRQSGSTQSSPPPPRSTSDPSSVDSAWRAASEPVPDAARAVVLPEPWWRSVLFAPLVALHSVYFLLPGAYEWEPASRREIVQACAIPPLGIAMWLMFTGRLTPWLGDSQFVMLGAWAVFLVVGLLIFGNVLPRLALAGGSTLLLVSGALDASLRTAGIPTMMAWVGVTLLSVLLAARVFVFGVLPTLGICWVLTQLA